jgi:EAL domain-containing protein (putative c-di-GMP-specific phosphodiesterase class I)
VRAAEEISWIFWRLNVATGRTAAHYLLRTTRDEPEDNFPEFIIHDSPSPATPQNGSHCRQATSTAVGHSLLNKQARIWVDAGLPPVTIAVNVSAMEFRQETFLDDIFRILEETGVDPKLFELELTESVLMKRAESVASVLQELRTRGVRVAVDDFGTGYSSLSYLSKFPIDALKIDQSFVRQISTTPEDTTIVSAIIGMGRSMKLRVIAEGVETPQELAFLQDQQCHEAQGYLFSKPVPAQQFAVLLETGISNWCNLRP